MYWGGGRVDFSQWLAQRRKAAGLTQGQLAVKCGLSAPYITRLERGSLEPPPRSTCQTLARALGCDFEEVWVAAFTIRLKKWLKREGYSKISQRELLELAKKSSRRTARCPALAISKVPALALPSAIRLA